jgi:hypothetical protein
MSYTQYVATDSEAALIRELLEACVEGIDKYIDDHEDGSATKTRLAHRRQMATSFLTHMKCIQHGKDARAS